MRHFRLQITRREVTSNLATNELHVGDVTCSPSSSLALFFLLPFHSTFTTFISLHRHFWLLCLICFYLFSVVRSLCPLDLHIFLLSNSVYDACSLHPLSLFSRLQFIISVSHMFLFIPAPSFALPFRYINHILFNFVFKVYFILLSHS